MVLTFATLGIPVCAVASAIFVAVVIVVSDIRGDGGLMGGPDAGSDGEGPV